MGGLVRTFFFSFLVRLVESMRYLRVTTARLRHYILRDDNLRMTWTLHVLMTVIAACVIGRDVRLQHRHLEFLGMSVSLPVVQM